MARNCLCLLPIGGIVFAVAAFITTYLVAVLREDVYPWWPYISDTASEGPERCIFGELLTLVAICSLLTAIARYKLVQACTLNDNKRMIPRINIAALVLAFIQTFCMTMVANFQETSLRVVHMPSACITFTAGVIYNCLHTVISREMCPNYNSRKVFLVRLVVSVIGVAAFISLYAAGIVAEYRGKSWINGDPDKKLEWNPQDPGWAPHIISSISEWIVGFSMLLFNATFIAEFTKIRIRLEPDLLVSHLSDSPTRRLVEQQTNEEE